LVSEQLGQHCRGRCGGHPLDCGQFSNVTRRPVLRRKGRLPRIHVPLDDCSTTPTVAAPMRARSLFQTGVTVASDSGAGREERSRGDLGPGLGVGPGWPGALAGTATQTRPEAAGRRRLHRNAPRGWHVECLYADEGRAAAHRPFLGGSRLPSAAAQASSGHDHSRPCKVGSSLKQRQLGSAKPPKIGQAAGQPQT